MKTSRTAHTPRKSPLAPLLACLATLLGLPVHAAVSIPDAPMQVNNGVPPNIWLILDDSGSMGWRYMYNPGIVSLTNGSGGPSVSNRTGNNTGSDATNGPTSFNLTAMYDQNYVTNTVYYNPNVTYNTWQQSGGSFMATTPYTAVRNSADFVDSGATQDLSTATVTFHAPTATNTNLGDATQYIRYRFHPTGATISGGGGALIVSSCPWDPAIGNFADANAATSLCTRNFASFTWANGVTRTVAQEKQNFATWFSFHRTRMKVAKAGVSSVFNDTSIFNADSDYRVGFTTIWNRNTYRIPVATNNGLFTGTNRDTWFTRLFGASASGTTPLRPALERAGQYFSETGTGGPWGPQATANQFQCRQNFTILTTDGFWNSGNPGTTYGNSDATADTTAEQKTRPDGAPYLYPAGLPFADSWSDTLADIAMHYWKTDLRTDLDNIVPVSASNPGFWQHMVTFGISIGLKGTLDPKTDLADLISGAKTWPNPMDGEDLDRIDDLFHASVNGRGSFVAAGNPDEFSDGLGGALRSIAERRGSGSNVSVTSASTSNSTNVFAALFFSSKWYGELKSFGIAPTGVNGVADWSASIPSSGRSIYTHNGSAGTTFPTAAQTTALGSGVAAYIAGDRSQEQPVGPYRTRVSLLGDIVNSSPTYLKTSDTVETVFVGSNDGMLHAFNAADGIERFAYVPRGLDMSRLVEFSDPSYSHRFFVDGPVIVSSTRVIGNRRILVGTLGRGGKGTFALDVTDPTTFDQSDVLWDKTGNTGDANMGQILGAPLMAKLNNGSVGIIVNNGINSTNERAVLQIYDLLTGALIEEIDTGAGSSSTPNGLSAPQGWDDDTDGIVDYVYAGDLLGNVWKFDLSSGNPNGWGVDNNRPLYAPTAGLSQPITGGVTIGLDPNTFKRWVFFGTGRFLSQPDLLDTSLQSWYGILDTGFNNSTRRTNLTARNIAQVSGFKRAFEPNTALPPTSRGWYVNLDTPPSDLAEGERMVGSQQLVGRALIASTIIPSTTNPCLPGRGYLNLVDAFTGTSLSSPAIDANNNGDFSDDVLNVGGSNVAIGSIDPGIGMVSDFATLDKLIVGQGSSGKTAGFRFRGERGVGRISWREITRN